MDWKSWLGQWWPPKPRPTTTTTTRPPRPTTTTTTRGPLPPLPPPPSGGPTDIDIELLQAHNAERAAHGKPPQVWDDQLYQAARGHSTHQASIETMGHKDIGNGDPWQRIRATGYRFTTASENVAAGYRSVEAVMRGWMNSSGHKANILGNTTEIGCAMVISPRGTWYFTTVFATPATVLIAGMGMDEIMSIDSVTAHSQDDEGETSSIHIRGEDEGEVGEAW